MCSLASQTCRRTGLLNCCHGIGSIRTCRWSLELGIMLYAIRGPRRVLSVQRPEPAQRLGAGARLIDAPDAPLSAEDAVVDVVLCCRRGSAHYVTHPPRGE